MGDHRAGHQHVDGAAVWRGVEHTDVRQLRVGGNRLSAELQPVAQTCTATATMAVNERGRMRMTRRPLGVL